MATATESSKEIVQQGFDALNSRDKEAFADLHADDAIIYVFGEKIHGIDAIVENQFGPFESFSGLKYSPEVVVAKGNTVTAQWTATGTHDGELDGIQPTDVEVEFPVMGTFQVEDGELVAVRILVDQLDLLGQLGVIEPPGE